MAANVLHLSDLHIGHEHGFLLPGQAIQIGHKEKTLVDAIEEDLSAQNVPSIAAIIISGDLTSNGQWKKNQGHVLRVLEDLCGRLQVPRERCLIVPGNHDYEWYEEGEQEQAIRKVLTPQPGQAPAVATDYSHETAFRTFFSHFYNVPVTAQIDRVVTIALGPYELGVGLLDSCKLTSTALHEYGYVDRTHLKRVIRDLGTSSQTKRLRILVLHHHVIPVVPTEEAKVPAVSVTLNAGELIEKVVQAGVSFVLHGHQHVPGISRIDRMVCSNDTWRGLESYGVVILSAGSAGIEAKRRRPDIPNTYSIIRFEADSVEVVFRKIRPVGDPWGDYLKKEFPLSSLKGNG